MQLLVGFEGRERVLQPPNRLIAYENWAYQNASTVLRHSRYKRFIEDIPPNYGPTGLGMFSVIAINEQAGTICALLSALLFVTLRQWYAAIPLILTLALVTLSRVRLYQVKRIGNQFRKGKPYTPHQS